VGNWLVGLLILVLLLILGWYLSYLAGRLDRLHHRVESSRAALETRLARRSAVALEVGRLIESPAGPELIRSANRTLTGPPDIPGDRRRPVYRPESAANRTDVATTVLVAEVPVSESSENDLTRALHRAFADPHTVVTLRQDPAASELLDELVRAGERVQLARRFHNDAVAHAQRMRRKRIVRWARLAGRAQLPRMVELDDSQPAALGGG
jgi:hypothetical protein